MQSIKKNYVFNLTYRIISIILPVVTTPYVSRVLGSENLGVNSYLESVNTYFLVFAALGTAFYGQREVARFRDEKEKLSSVFWEIETLSIITTSVCLLAWIVFSSFQNRFNNLYFILSLNILAIAFDISWLYTGLERFDKILYKNLAIKALSLLFLFTCVKTKEDLNIYILINSVGVLVGNGSLWIKVGEHVLPPRIQPRRLLIHFKNTLVYFLPTVATTIYTILDKTMLQVITTDFNQNGYYEQAVKLCRIPMTVLLSMDTVMGSRMSYLVEKKRDKEIHDRLEKSIQLVFFLGVPIVLGLDLVIVKMIPWFLGDGFGPVADIVYVYSPLVICIGINNCLSEQYLTPIGKRKQTSIIVCISAVINFILNCLLIPRFKSIGASIASVFSEAFIAFSYMVLCRRTIRLREYIRLSYKNIIAAILMCIITYYITNSLNSTIICTVLQIGVGVCVYILILYVIKDNFLREIVQMFFKKRKEE